MSIDHAVDALERFLRDATFAKRCARLEQLLSQGKGPGSGSEPGFVVVQQLFLSRDDVFFRQDLREAIAGLVREWSPRIHSGEYLHQLLVLVGYLRAVPACDEIATWLIHGSLKGRIGGRDDLHRTSLRVFAGLGLGRAIRGVLERDVHSREYSAICYLCLWQSGGEDPLHNGIEYLPALLANAAEDEIDQSIANYISVVTLTYVREHLHEALQVTSPDLQDRLFGALKRLGKSEELITLMAARAGYRLSSSAGYYIITSPTNDRVLARIELVGILPKDVLDRAATANVLDVIGARQ